ncbi:putative pigment precursor permease, P-loop containing nucleoside triphosphate hydrolase [Lupinus albus]|uniref:Putative pigment permease, P-loop containing nucleoside triphosphate hydrolase n=1 Tax=Lupinus albus TaxID=3870 RepID=A0A6A4NTF0_LUPAL|nr:putative pigment precursor permease, P-loop containing nucleoside triphosphate hydrolase [Lupinus albus]
MDQEISDIESQTIYKTTLQEEAPHISHKAKKCHVILKFDDVTYKIKTKKGKLLDKKTMEEEKVILKGVTGIVEPGEILAMLGPSGSGKTTLLTALGGRLGGKLHGTITYNGQPLSNVIKRNSGFVTQDDVLYPHLTVTETLVFTALLRLPNSVTKEEKIVHAKAVIDQLGLTKCKDSIVGGTYIRGVSGGERKRVSIGQEMLINPSLLFLDEPTSGLDSTTAQKIVSTLWEVANEGKTIVMTIHQPSSRLYYMFHKVLLLSEGNSLYYGKGSEAIHYFSNIGYAPALAMNPADFLLDLANGVYTNELKEDHVIDKQQLVLAYKSNIEAYLKAGIHEISDSGSSSEGEFKDRGFGKWPTSWSQQFFVLLRRYLKEKKHESFSSLKIVQIILTALLAGLLWYKSVLSHLQDQIGLLFFICGFWSFIPLYQAIFTFPQEVKMLEKERSSGMYRLSSYFMSRIVAELPMDLVLPTIFILIIYWLAGLKANFLSFLCTLFTLLLHVLVSQGLGLAIGAIVLDQKSATTFASVLMLCFSLVAGFYVQHMPKFIHWMKYISNTHYTYQLLIGSQYYTGETYPCSKGQCLVEEYPSIKEMGFPNLHEKVVAAIVLVIMLIGYRLVAYFSLMRVGVTKKLT